MMKCALSLISKSLNYNVALRNEEVVDKDDVDKYIWQHSSYALDDDGDILYGWVVSVYVKTVLGKLYHLLLRGMKVRFHLCHLFY